MSPWSRCRTSSSTRRPAAPGADGREIVLSRKEFDLVHALITRAGDIVTRDELMREVWHTTFWTSSKTIDVHLGWVRRKLGDDSPPAAPDHHDPRQGPALRGHRPDRPARAVAHRQALAFWRASRARPHPRRHRRRPAGPDDGAARDRARAAAAAARRGRGRLRGPGHPRPHGRRLPRPRHPARGHRRAAPSSPSTTSTSRPTTCTPSRTPGSPYAPGRRRWCTPRTRRVMRERLAELGVPCPRNAVVASVADVEAFGFPCVLKTTRGGYDGKGVWFVSLGRGVRRAVPRRRGHRRPAARRGARRLPPRALGAGRAVAERPGGGVPRRRVHPAGRHLPRGGRPGARPRPRARRPGPGDRAADRRRPRRHRHPRRRAVRDHRRPGAGQRARDAAAQHRSLDPGRRRHLAVREPPARRARPAARLAGARGPAGR